MIRETVVVTTDSDGRPHIAPLGLIADGEDWIIAPFAPSTTLDNLRAVPEATASHVDDVRIIAGCLTGRRDWPLSAAARIRPPRLAAALSHLELAVVRVEEHAQRPRFTCRVVHRALHRASDGHNRAQAAVIEAAILVSRLSILPSDKVASEMAYLQIAVDKTGGAAEHVAWQWLIEAIASHRSENGSAIRQTEPQ